MYMAELSRKVLRLGVFFHGSLLSHNAINSLLTLSHTEGFEKIFLLFHSLSLHCIGFHTIAFNCLANASESYFGGTLHIF